MSAYTWEVEYTDEFASWWETLTVEQQESVIVAVRTLEKRGPGLGRPFVDTVRGSHHANMKELRPSGGYLRIFFAFDPRRAAILLIGGDKAKRWRVFYERMIPLADALYDDHLREIGES